MKRLCAPVRPASSSPVRRLISAGAACVLGSVLLGGCSAPAKSSGDAGLSTTASIGVSAEEGAQPSRAPAIIDGRVVSWSELRERLSEIGGATALREIALDRALEREIERAGVELAADAIERERALLLEELAAGGEASGETRVLEVVRRQRGLGDVGFERLLRRNAMLRALSAPGVTVEPREVDLALEIRYGPRKLARIIVTASEREAASIRQEIVNARGDRLDAFTARAATRSIDASGARGGWIGRVSPKDPAYPDAVRRALAALRPGEISNVLAIEGGYAIVMVEREIDAETFGDEARAKTERSLLRRKQRLEMDRLADRLLARTSVSVLDASLAWSWAGRGG